MIFDIDDAPVTDNEYQQRLLSAIITVVQAAGGRVTIPAQALAVMPDQASNDMVVLQQDRLENGDLLLSVTRRARRVHVLQVPKPEAPTETAEA